MAVMSNLDKTAERNSEKSTFRVWSLICHQGSRSGERPGWGLTDRAVPL